jgi:glycerophosphoryl diester phosphodiesterase
VYISIIVFGFSACIKKFEAPIPDTRWTKFDSASALPLSFGTRQKTEGIYTVTNGSADFGESAAVKWSYYLNGTDTSFYLSFFCEKEVSYFICEGRRQDSNILLNGYWRKMVTTGTGKVRLSISAKNGAKLLLGTTALTASDSIVIDGVYGSGDEVPATALRLKFTRPLYKAKPMQIVAHRLGGRNADLLPASENSLELLKLASRFGATGVEADVRLTNDGVPVIFHDATLNDRLIQKNGLVGPIENYSYAQLNTLVRLLQGEKIPTLREVLNSFVYNTSLSFLWIDTKYDGPMQILRDMQKEFLQKAAAIGRTVDISIGIPDKDVLKNFMQLPGYQNIPSVCELSIEDVIAVNAAIWAPRWTLGTQNEEVAKMHAQGRKAYVWTLDVPGNIATFIKEGKFDGILSNYPSAVAYYYYAQQ